MPTQQVHSQDIQTPLVSFIVTTFNLPTAYLKECLESITALSLAKSEREIIVVDDGSDISPINELLELREHIVYIRQENQGVSEARNTGIRAAQGKFIQFVDGDDYLFQAPYEHCLDLVRYHEPDVVMFELSTNRNSKATFDYSGPMDGATFMRHHNINGAIWGYIFKRELLVDLRFTSRVAYGEDEEFTPQLLLRAERLFTTDARAYFYRQHAASALHKTGNRSKLTRLHDNLQVIEHLRYLADRMPHGDREALTRRVAQLTMDYIYNVITLTKSRKYLEKSIGELSDKGLFPLPEQSYTGKYTLFRKLTQTPLRRILLFTLLSRTR